MSGGEMSAGNCLVTMTMTMTMTNVLLNINAYSDLAKYSL